MGWDPALLTLLSAAPLQKKKGKEAGPGAPAQPSRTPALPPEARVPHASSLATAKRNKTKAKGKEVKKEVRLPLCHAASWDAGQGLSIWEGSPAYTAFSTPLGPGEEGPGAGYYCSAVPRHTGCGPCPQEALP